MAMEQGILTDNKDADLIREIVDRIVSPRGFKDIKANIADYETPARLTRKSESGDEAFIPDVTGTLNGRKSYFELALKTDDEQQAVTKWKLLSNVARFKNGKFFLVVPRGHYAFANRLISQYTIEAEVLKM